MKRAAWGTTAFFFLAPGTVAGLVPWWLTGWDRPADGSRVADVAGGALVAIGNTVVIAAFVQFVREGRGTPAPIAPTEQLVVGGVYRHVRNPMYVAVTAVIIGQALLLGRGELGWYALGFWALTHSTAAADDICR